jgi:hypothetical protein
MTLWVKGGHGDNSARCTLYAQKQTSRVPMSERTNTPFDFLRR